MSDLNRVSFDAEQAIEHAYDSLKYAGNALNQNANIEDIIFH